MVQAAKPADPEQKTIKVLKRDGVLMPGLVLTDEEPKGPNDDGVVWFVVLQGLTEGAEVGVLNGELEGETVIFRNCTICTLGNPHRLRYAEVPEAWKRFLVTR